MSNDEISTNDLVRIFDFAIGDGIQMLQIDVAMLARALELITEKREAALDQPQIREASE